MLIARSKRATAQQTITHASTKMSSVDYSSDLARMQRRIEEQEAHAAAEEEVSTSSVDDQFKKLGDNDDVEKKLADLKQKMGKT